MECGDINGARKMLIRKEAIGSSLLPNLQSYDDSVADFRWDAARQGLTGMPADRGTNLAFEAVDRHVLMGRGGKLAIRWCSGQGGVKDFTYSDLAKQSNAFANVLKSHGVGASDTVFSLLGRIPELYITCLGALKNKSVFCPLFSAFGPEPVRMRLELGAARVLVTTERLYERKIAGIRSTLPRLEHVFLVSENMKLDDVSGIKSFAKELLQAATEFDIPLTTAEDPALLHFTSGTTGTPKGALHVHDAVIFHKETGRLVLDLKPDDIYWCTADPGLVTGTSYGIFAPLTNGVTIVVEEGEFDPERWYRILEREKVTVWYTAPTAIRMLMKAGDDLPRRFNLSSLRHIASVGEPLNPEAVLWGERVLGRPIHDNWWQTETGGIMIANFPAMDIKPGSMGRPVPGVEVAIVKTKDKGSEGIEIIDTPDVEGELAIKAPWPSMFRTYLGQEERYKKCFRGGWYLTGDLARRDSDGYFWFVGRSDDVIKSSGHLIGPFEVESTLMEHPAVAEAGVIGKPDPLLGESVKAFVSLKAGYTASDGLRKELIALARKRLGPAVAPREISFLDSLPKTRSGKVMRRLLKARELGLPEGDTSTLENATEGQGA